MTIQTEFYNWQVNPKGYDWNVPPYESCSPRCQSYRMYGAERWSMDFLGCHVDRSIVGGKSVSSHAYGAAIDLSWRQAGRQVLDDQILPFFVGFSQELGLQAIHDYDGLKIWRPPAYRDKLGQNHMGGWRGSSGGQFTVGNRWIHLETLDTRFLDGRSVQELTEHSGGLKTVTVAAEPIELTPENRQQTKGHPDVLFFQRNMAGLFVQTGNTDFDVAVDGDYGPDTQQACRTFQLISGLEPDAQCGQRTWTKLMNP